MPVGIWPTTYLSWMEWHEEHASFLPHSDHESSPLEGANRRHSVNCQAGRSAALPGHSPNSEDTGGILQKWTFITYILLHLQTGEPLKQTGYNIFQASIKSTKHFVNIYLFSVLY